MLKKLKSLKDLQDITSKPKERLTKLHNQVESDSVIIIDDSVLVDDSVIQDETVNTNDVVVINDDSNILDNSDVIFVGEITNAENVISSKTKDISTNRIVKPKYTGIKKDNTKTNLTRTVNSATISCTNGNNNSYPDYIPLQLTGAKDFQLYNTTVQNHVNINANGNNIYNAGTVSRTGLRMIVIDGSNVAIG